MSRPDCFKGSVHEGTPQGRVTEICGLPTYVSKPQGDRSAKGILVMIPDAFGIDAVNNKLLADRYATKGDDYLVYLPDFMKVPWYLINRPVASYPRVTAFLQALRVEESDLPIGAAGFCWGGKQAILLAGDGTKVNGKPMIDAAFVGHPGLLELPGDFERIQRPVAFALAEKDKYAPPDTVNNIRDIMGAKPDELKGEVIVYPNTGHGFCLRADTSFTDIVRQSLLAEDQCIDWFNRHLVRG